MSTEWKQIEGFGGIYYVSNQGAVLNKRTGLIRKNVITAHGYSQVALWFQGKNKSFLVHRIVAEAFIPNTFNKPQINHINGDKQDNSVNNIEWCTPTENNRHAYRTGLNIPVRGGKRAFAKPVRSRATGEVYETISDCARALNLKKGVVQSMIAGRSYNRLRLEFIIKVKQTA